MALKLSNACHVANMVKRCTYDMDQMRAESHCFFEALATDLTSSYASLSSRLKAMEDALVRNGGGGQGGRDSTLGTPAVPVGANGGTAANPAAPCQSAGAALALADKLREGHSIAFSFDALVAEVERDHEATQAAERQQRKSAPNDPNVSHGHQQQHQQQHQQHHHHNQHHGGASTPPGSFSVHSHTAHNASIRSRHGDLDASETSYTATPVRRSKASAPSSPSAAKSSPAAEMGTPNDPRRRLAVAYDDNARPFVRDAAQPKHLEVPRAINSMQPTSALVEFKRQRVLQYESDFYVAPGEHVVVGGDRGEDIGLVTYSWPTHSSGPPTPQKSREQGVGRVLRVASTLEVGQLQGVQAELEKRAKEVAQQKVQEHQLPMMIVDAEYQFDRKKLTFFYQSQHRLDFRVLVRDLYKTFRARIWMELV